MLVLSDLAWLLLCGLAAFAMPPPSLKTAGFQRQYSASVAAPVSEFRFHYAGNIWMALTNAGQFGIPYGGPAGNHKDLRQMAIDYGPSFEFPAGTRNEYLSSCGLWFGGIVGSDTLVSKSVGSWSSYEDEITSLDTIMEASSAAGSPYYDGGIKYQSPTCSLMVIRNASADQQYYAHYTDTVIGFHFDEADYRPHLPLGLDVSQTSYAWSDRSSRDFIIVQLWVRNVGKLPITGFSLGIMMDADIYNRDNPGGWSMDDISGYLESAPNVRCSEIMDPMGVAWSADNNGDPSDGNFQRGSPRGAIGVRLLDAPPVKGTSFNWWSSSPDWGPTRKYADGDPVGIPRGDRASYRLMINQSIDYDQSFAGLDYTNTEWKQLKTGFGCSLSGGTDTRFLLSAGPLLDVFNPGDSIRFAFAFLAGENFHRDPGQVFNCLDPQDFLNHKDFSGLAAAARMAGWVYDVPNFDTDCDGYSGDVRLCKPDQVEYIDNKGIGHWMKVYREVTFYVGDLGVQPSSSPSMGAPDLRGPQPPPCPDDLSLETRPGKIILRWSGRTTELAKDPTLGIRDFEGYNVYLGRHNDPNSYSLAASWDLENYKRYFYYPWYNEWWSNDSIYSVAEIRRIVGDPTFEPYKFRERSAENCFADTITDQYGRPQVWCSYFERVGSNNGNIIREDGREWANKIQRVRVDTSVADGDTLEYGTYEMILDDLQPSVGQYVVLTVFDRGDPSINLDSRETRPGACFEYAVPIYSANVVAKENLKVSVYPNPYKIAFPDENGRLTNYYMQGYEAPDKNGETGKFAEQDRRIHFINLPDTATISIYSLAGDLIRTIQHPDWNLTEYSSECAWDLVSRNAQAVVSGIYIYRVTSTLGSQVGKIVIIK